MDDPNQNQTPGDQGPTQGGGEPTWTPPAAPVTDPNMPPAPETPVEPVETPEPTPTPTHEPGPAPEQPETPPAQPGDTSQ